MTFKRVKLFYPYIITALLTLIFATLAKVVIEKETYILDLNINSWISSLQTPLLTAAMKIISDIGMIGGVLIIICISLNLFYKKQFHILLAVLAGSFGATLLNYFIKLIIARNRPELTSRLVVESGFSFPSGHSTTAFLAFPILAITIYFSLKIPKIYKFVFVSKLAIWPELRHQYIAF